jgi:hypothetical protein
MSDNIKKNGFHGSALESMLKKYRYSKMLLQRHIAWSLERYSFLCNIDVNTLICT